MIDPRVKEILGRDYSQFLSVERAPSGTQIYAAGLIDFPGCVMQGATSAEARERLNAMLPGYFARLLQIGAPIPEPEKLPAVLPGLIGVYDSNTGLSLTGKRSELGEEQGKPRAWTMNEDGEEQDADLRTLMA